MQSRGEDAALLEDTGWTLDLAFLTDITGKRNSLNWELQGKGSGSGSREDDRRDGCSTSALVAHSNIRSTTEVSRGTFVLRRTPESSPVQEDCSVLRTHRCSEFPAVQGDCVWFGDSPMDLGRADAASRSPCAAPGPYRTAGAGVVLALVPPPLSLTLHQVYLGLNVRSLTQK
ncbi:hypothetical protein D4764_0159700 [Takifugu flavidus]|uniref:Uncharacterized protein n=1 Tax=Takifugu flavidus TaxID=433684 RepID=A0A5C6MKL8_9TELE|nr:hypothetical protein D4764_0159700 [Takifugu flavidus]